MTAHFQKSIELLKKKVLQILARVEESLQMAVTAVTERDVKLARKVHDGDADIDQMEVEIEEDCLRILALYQPVAYDLRFIVAALKINNDLERIGDYAVNIAKRTRFIAGSHVQTVPFDLDGMLRLTMQMVKKSTDAFIQTDIQIANEVIQSDDEIDNRHKQAYSAVENEILKQPDAAGYFISLLGISRNLERIADHATNIAEDVIYLVEGDIIRHKSWDINE